MSRRVVISGLGVVAPNGVGLDAFENALRNSKSGISFLQELSDLKFACQVGGIPDLEQVSLEDYLSPLQIKNLKSKSIIYGIIAAKDAWKDAGLGENDSPDWDMGCIFGSGITGIEVLRESIYKVDDLNVRRLGGTVVEQTMGSGISAHLSGIFGLGNQVTSNSSACSTGTEAIIMGYERIISGRAERMLVGSCDSAGPYVWGGFDSMRVLNRKSNEEPQKASCPLSANASGFVPGSGSGAMILETYESAKARGAEIYAEIIGGNINSGGQRSGGTMTAPNSEGIQRCISETIKDADIEKGEIDAISGHLTSTMGDVLEIKNWSEALGRKGDEFPMIHSMKSMIGHCLGAAGSIECVGVALQLKKGFFHASLNAEELHPEIQQIISSQKIPKSSIDTANFNIIAKSSFGFGDVNSCIIFRKFVD